MKVILLGAGHIGNTIARLLCESGDYAVTVVDKTALALSQVASLPCTHLVRDAHDPAVLTEVMLGADAVINALPYNFATMAAGQAKLAGCHYFDLTEDTAATREIRRLAENAATAFMPQCGLAPGFISVVAHNLTQSFESLHDVKMRVGALPAFPTNSLKYNLTWSVDGLINEYCQPCDAIRDGERIELLPLEGLEHFSLDGVEYEAFNTSGGLGTLCDTLQGRVRNLDYKSVRYPGHYDLMKVFLEDLQLKHDQDTLKNILRKAVPTTMQDVVLVFVTVSGMRSGQLVQEVFARKIFADRGAAHSSSAIQITTAAGVCTALDLFREGKLPKRGFIRQEDIPLPAFLANRFGSAYEQSRRVDSIS